MENRVDILLKKTLVFMKIKLSNKQEKLFIQIIKFLIVGGIATLIDWLIYFVLYNYFNMEPLYANIISFSTSTVYNFFASIKFVFKVDERNKKRNFIIFVTFSLIGLLLSELIIYFLINKLNINKMLAKIIATVFIMVFNFVTRKKFLEK